MTRLAALNEHVKVRVIGEDGRPLLPSADREGASADPAAISGAPATVAGAGDSVAGGGGGGGIGSAGGGNSGGIDNGSASPLSLGGSSTPPEWWSDPSALRPYSAIVACDLPYPSLLRLSAAARAAGTKLVACWSAGLFGGMFCDFGDEFEVADTDGEAPRTALLEHVTWSGDAG
jgi:hypothetical protein